uniref:Dynactin subunit 2 n=1 Tax=Trichuris muris TaxID=70415 RepID=A0A5S6QGD2_TRIMR
MPEDVYETGDLPESDQPVLVKENFESEHIDSISLRPLAAYEAFKGKSLDSAVADFSDSIAIRRRRGYESGRTLIELVNDQSEPETLAQQYNRLNCEIAELSEKLAKLQATSEEDGRTSDSLDAITVDQANNLQNQLKQLQTVQILGTSAALLADRKTDHVAMVSQAIQSLKEVAPSHIQQSTAAESAPKKVTLDIYAPLDCAQSSFTAKAAILESRLASLEKLVGSDSEKQKAIGTEVAGGSITDVVDALKSKVSLLDNSQLDVLEARLSALTEKLTFLADKKQSVHAAEAEKIDHLYKLVTKWDAVCDSLPSIADRLQSLQRLHEQAVQFSQYLTYLDAVQQRLARTLDSNAAILQQVKEAFDVNSEQIINNVAAFQRRLAALEKHE